MNDAIGGEQQGLTWKKEKVQGLNPGQEIFGGQEDKVESGKHSSKVTHGEPDNLELMLVKNYFEEEKLANGFGQQKVIADFGKTVFIE